MKLTSKLMLSLAEDKSESYREILLDKYFEKTTVNCRSSTLSLLLGRVPKKVIDSETLREWIIEFTKFPDWLYDECVEVGGDKNVSASLMIPEGESLESIDLYDVYNGISDLHEREIDFIKQKVFKYWTILDKNSIVLFNKLITGSFRSPLDAIEVHQLLSKISGLETFVISKRLSGRYKEDELQSATLFRAMDSTESILSPLNFKGVAEADTTLNYSPEDWTCEWHYDGLRVQIVKKQNQIHLWTKKGEDLAGKFPELDLISQQLPDSCIMDAQVVSLNDGVPSGFADLKDRLKAKRPKKQIGIYVFDILKLNSEDLRERSLVDRRSILSENIDFGGVSALRCTDHLSFATADDLKSLLSKCKEYAASGIVLKRSTGTYNDEGDWLKLNADLKYINAVLLYGQRSRFGANDMFNEFTFGVKEGDSFVPVARTKVVASSGIRKDLDELFENNTIEKFGPVRSVKPEHFFKIGFREIRNSNRHKAGLQINDAVIVDVHDEALVDNLSDLKNYISELLLEQRQNFASYTN